MFLYQCNICDFKTNYLTKYNQHCQSATHLNYKFQLKNKTNTKNKILETKFKVLEDKIKVLEDKNKILEDKNKILEEKFNILDKKINKIKSTELSTIKQFKSSPKIKNINIDNKNSNNKELLKKNNEKQKITECIEETKEINNIISDVDNSLEEFFNNFQ